MNTKKIKAGALWGLVIGAVAGAFNGAKVEGSGLWVVFGMLFLGGVGTVLGIIKTAVSEFFGGGVWGKAVGGAVLGGLLMAIDTPSTDTIQVISKQESMFIGSILGAVFFGCWEWFHGRPK